MKRYAVHAIRPGLVGASRAERDAVLCRDPRWCVSEDCGDPVTCRGCLREIERMRRAKTTAIEPCPRPSERRPAA